MIRALPVRRVTLMAPILILSVRIDGNKGTEMALSVRTMAIRVLIMALSVRTMAIRVLIMYRTRELTELALFNNAFGSIGRRQLLAAARQCPQLDLALEPV